MDDRVDVQVHGEHAVGAGDGFQSDGSRAVTGGMEGDSVPGEREFRFADGGVSGGRGVAIDDEGEVDGGVATRGIGDDHGVLALIRESDGVVDVVG